MRGLKRAQCIIAVSNFLKHELIHKVGIPDDRIHVIHEGIDHSLFYPQRVPIEFLKQYGIEKNFKYILYVGSEQPEKNFLTLIKAFALLCKQRKDVKLLKVGQPEFNTEREKAISAD